MVISRRERGWDVLHGSDGVDGEAGESLGSVISFSGRCCCVAFFLLPETFAKSSLL
jgi:hypothetical protein